MKQTIGYTILIILTLVFIIVFCWAYGPFWALTYFMTVAVVAWLIQVAIKMIESK